MNTSIEVVRVICDAEHDDDRRRLSVPFFRDEDGWETTMAHIRYRPNDSSLYRGSQDEYDAFLREALNSPSSQDLVHEVVVLTCRAPGCRAAKRTSNDRSVRLDNPRLHELLERSALAGIDCLPVAAVLHHLGSGGH